MILRLFKKIKSGDKSLNIFKKIKLIKRKPLNISQFISLMFLGIIIVGTLLLLLPVSSRSGESCGIRVALFTATSATCVTGLSLVDTFTQWSLFGQIIILAMIEVGGLGFMTAASLVIFSLKKKVTISQRMVMAQSFGSDDLFNATRIQKSIIQFCLLVESIGAILLALRFIPEYGLKKSIYLGIFHSVSAFCNAGFDVLGFDTPGQSIIKFGSDPAICIVLASLIIIGGLGFLVWDEIGSNRHPKKWSVYTKLVLLTTAALLLFGTVFFCITEWNNPRTLGDMTFWQKIIASFFQSATTRTAGFAGIDQGAMTDGGKAITIFLMYIGGSSGSTAGGLKTVTFIVLFLFLYSRIRGNISVNAFNRTIPNKSILDAITISMIMVILSFFGGTIISLTSEIGFTDGLFESVSALATVGLSTGITSSLPLIAQLLMIVYMYFGRVGILTVSIGFIRNNSREVNHKYAETNLLIG